MVQQSEHDSTGVLVKLVPSCGLVGGKEHSKGGSHCAILWYSHSETKIFPPQLGHDQQSTILNHFCA